MDRREFIAAAGIAAALASASQAFAHCVATANDCLQQKAESGPILGPFELVDQDGPLRTVQLA